jgi:hypothetical protein
LSDHLVQQYPEWREAIKKFTQQAFASGDVLTFEWLYGAFGIARPLPTTQLADAQKAELRFLSQYKEFEDALLREHQIALANVRGVGYRLVPPSEQTGWAEQSGVGEIKKAVRKLGDRLTNVDLTRLSVAGRKENADALARLAMLSGMTKHAVEFKSAIAKAGNEIEDS